MDRIRLIASDYRGYFKPSECELRVWLGAHGVEEAEPGPFPQLLMRLGLEHEARHLERFPNHVDLGDGSIAERALRTEEEIAVGERVIYQGAFRHEMELAGTPVEIVGVPDFLLPARQGYAIRDSKLSRRLGGRIEIELQLQLYGWLYEQTFGEPPTALQVHAGSGEILDAPYDGGSRALDELERILTLRLADDKPQTYMAVSKCSDCGYFDHCWPKALKQGVVGLVPGFGRGLIEELQSQGIETIDQVLDRFDEATFADVEYAWGAKRKKVGGKAPLLLARARAVKSGAPILLETPAIPSHPNYAMFDLEGMPPRLDELENIYIWGLQLFGEDPGPFLAATAGFAPEGDREGWEAFLANAAAILAHHGDIPFVHWGSYEKAKMNLYVGRYGDPDGVAARVLKNLLDLHPIATNSVAAPTPSYSLKEIELVAGYQRQVTDAGGDWSMAAYIEATETADHVRRAEIMDKILAYNREDLEATWAVLEWLRELGSPK